MGRFLNTTSCRSEITFIDGDNGILRYRGYPIEELAEHDSFLQVAWLLLNGELPDDAGLQEWTHRITHHAFVHENIKKFIDGFHHDAHPMGILETEVLRGILTPVGRRLWTSILGGVLFAAAARAGRLRVSGALLGWYLVVALLHGLWDASRGIAVWLTLLPTGTPLQWLLITSGRTPDATQAQGHLFTILNWALLAVDAAPRWRGRPGG